jgi:hypothetical protein
LASYISGVENKTQNLAHLVHQLWFGNDFAFCQREKGKAFSKPVPVPGVLVRTNRINILTPE